MKMLTSFESLFNFSRRKLFIAFFIVIIAQIIDATIGNLSDVLKQFTISLGGISLFLVISGICIFGQFFILGMVKKRNKDQIIKGIRFNTFERIVTIVQYALTAIMIIVAMQIIISSQYYTFLINITIIISTGLGIYLMSSLSFWFFSWFRILKTIILLLYGLSSVAFVIFLVSTNILFNTILIEKSSVINPQSDVIFPSNLPGSIITLANTLQTYSALIAFILLWGGNIILLSQNIHRIGRVKFWILLSMPLILFSSFYLSIYQSIAGTLPAENLSSVVMPVLLIIFPGIIAISLIGFSFYSISKPLDNTTIIKDFMIITSYGIILFFTTTLTSIAGLGFPPFGLLNILLIGPFSFLISNSFYRSAISVAEDINLRKSIKNTTKKELKLLDDIGTAKMYQEIEKKVTLISKANADSLLEQTGIEPSLTDNEIRDLFSEIIKSKQEFGH